MDSLAALALATGRPTDDLLKREPQDRDNYLISRRMTKHITFGGIYQSIWLLVVAFTAEYWVYEPNVLKRYDYAHERKTIVSGKNKSWPDSNFETTDDYERWLKPRKIERPPECPVGVDVTKCPKGLLSLDAFKAIAKHIDC